MKDYVIIIMIIKILNNTNMCIIIINMYELKIKSKWEGTIINIIDYIYH